MTTFCMSSPMQSLQTLASQTLIVEPYVGLPRARSMFGRGAYFPSMTSTSTPKASSCRPKDVAAKNPEGSGSLRERKARFIEGFGSARPSRADVSGKCSEGFAVAGGVSSGSELWRRWRRSPVCAQEGVCFQETRLAWWPQKPKSR